jgi:serine/threonine protein kinase/Tol biopolymer transport system component
MIGTTLSHYRIEAELGRGGMGIVYRAEDTTLDRTVAIKVLPSAALASEDDRARFYREAKAAAALNHPHIAQIYQIGEAVPSDAPHGTQPSPFIAMEFIDGNTLEDRIRRSPLKIDEAVRIAAQVADALRAAHAKQIVHRDIKSANIMLSGDGQAKVLDFGLAQTSASTKLTRMGSTLGTIAYMSPEQARGEEVDSRTDLYSLGTVLYEMISGRLPFGGEYEQAVVYSILNADPEPLTALRTGVPMALEAVVTKALRKESRLRYQSAADMIADLSSITLEAESAARYSASNIPASGTIPLDEAASQSGLVPQSQSQSHAYARMGVLIVVAVLAALIGILASRWILPKSAGRSPLDVKLTLPGLDAMINREDASSRLIIAYSPDGKKVAYLGVDPENGLMVQDLTSGLPARQVAVRAESPAFSPDSRFLAFTSEGSLFRVGLQGEAPDRIAENVPDVVGLQWAGDGYLYFAPDYAEGIRRVREDGSGEEWVTRPDSTAGDIGYVYPFLMPDGKHMVYGKYGWGGFELVLHNLALGTDKVLGSGVSPRFVEPDILLFAQGPRLLAAELDMAAGSLGAPITITDKLYVNQASFASNYDVSDSGDILYIDGWSTWGVPLEIRYWDGSRKNVTPDVNDASYFELSPDGRQIVITANEPVTDPDIWIFDLQTSDTSPLVDHRLYDSNPTWSADGTHVFFSSERDGNSELYSIDVTTKNTELIYKSDVPKYSTSTSPDGRYLSFHAAGELFILDLRGGSEPVELASNLASDRGTHFSPGSDLLAYTSEELSTSDVYALPLPANGKRHRLTVGGGGNPKWSNDGRSLYYKMNSSLYRVAVNANGSRGGEPERIMDDLYGAYDLLPDGSGILTRAAPPLRSARLMQGAIERIKKELTSH